MANLEPMPISSLPEGTIQDGDKMIVYRDSTGKAYQSDTGALAEVASLLSDVVGLKEEVAQLSSDLTELNSNMSDLITTQTFTFDNQTVSANSYASFDFDVTNSGYKALGVISFRFSNASSEGTPTSWVCPYCCYLTDTNQVTVSARNTNTSTSAKILVRIIVLYVKN